MFYRQYFIVIEDVSHFQEAIQFAHIGDLTMVTHRSPIPSWIHQYND